MRTDTGAALEAASRRAAALASAAEEFAAAHLAETVLDYQMRTACGIRDKVVSAQQVHAREPLPAWARAELDAAAAGAWDAAAAARDRAAAARIAYEAALEEAAG